MQPCGLDVAALTEGQPFCAGVVLMVDGRLVLTLNHDHLPAGLDGTALRVGGVGGGQEAGETIWECAMREAREEVERQVNLVSAPRTFLMGPNGPLRPVRCRDDIAPLLFAWGPHPTPDEPYEPDLPAGRLLYNAMFLARPRGAVRPGDVDGLLLMPPAAWPLVERQGTIREAIEDGASLVERMPIPHDTRLWAFPEDSMKTVCDLAARAPELLAPLS
jgi:8-oxo-dGTP pyrophosphatase MutT (NUDIX family)